MTDNMSPEVRSAFDGFPNGARQRLLDVRSEIFRISAELSQAVRIDETLKWGQPSYATKPKTGTPIRLGLSGNDEPTIFVHCQTTLVRDYRAIAPPELRFVDNRAVVLTKSETAFDGFLCSFIEAALTYHVEKDL